MNEIQTESIETIAKRGGKRKGAGRPSLGQLIQRDPRWLAARGVNPLTAAEILSHVVDERATWQRILSSDDDRVVLSALVFLTSMRDGKPSQQINVTSTNLTLNARDIQQARDIVREIRGEIPEVGIAASNNPSLGISESSPLQVDADAGEEIASSKPILSGDEGGN